MSYKAFYSNRSEKLYDYLKESLFSPLVHPFTRRMVIVASPSIKSWLMLRLAKDPDVGIAAGMEIGLLDEWIQKLRGQFQSKNSLKKIPTPVELGLALESELRRLYQEFDLLSHEEQEIYFPLFNYLHLDTKQAISKKSEKRIIDLSHHLTDLFSSYGRQGEPMVAEWCISPIKNWQQGLWNRLFNSEAPWTYLARELNDPIIQEKKQVEAQVHLFSIGFLPPLYHRYLSKLSSYLPVHYYILSPCQFFWSDIRSDREASYLVNSLKNSPEQQLEELEQLLRDRNPLLANSGRIGRIMAELAESAQGSSVEHYLLPEGACHFSQLHATIPHNTELLQEKHPFNLLEAVQADMLLLRNPDQEAKLIFREWDESIQVHSSSSKRGEVQMIYNLLMHIIKKHANDEDPISPADIIVMAPDISEYEPYVRMIFESSESQLSVQMMDLQVSGENKPLQAFLQLLSLAVGRWEAASLLTLFEFRAFQKKQGWSKEELYEIREWIDRAEIRWGNDANHRKELLIKDHGPDFLLEDSFAGTWEFGIQRLMAGLAFEETMGDTLTFAAEPLNIESSSAELLGRFIKILKGLHKDLQPLSQNRQMSLRGWVDYLQQLNEIYFDFSEEEESSSILEELFQNLKYSSRYFPSQFFSFSSIKKHIEGILNAKKTTYRETSLHSVHFCSLLPMRTIPAKVIVILGLEEESYTRREKRSSLNLLNGFPGADYYPSQTDFDRYLFLEALLSARRYFITSYLCMTQEDYKEQQPSLLIEELVDYLDRAYEVEGKAPSTFCKYMHPFHAFDKKWWWPEAPFRSFSKNEYRLGCAFYLEEKVPFHEFIPSFSLPVFESITENIRITLGELVAFAKNPLKTYCNKTLGIYLPFSKDIRVQNEETLLPNNLQQDQLKKLSFKKSFKEICTLAEKKGFFGPGLYQQVAENALKEKIEELHDNLCRVGVDPQELVEIVFSEAYEKVEQTPEGNWRVPPLLLPLENNKHIKIIGKIKDISPKGMVVHANEKDSGKFWPEFLVFHTLVKLFQLPIEPHLIFAKKGKIYIPPFDSAHDRLQKYVVYYISGLKTPSPLLPEWIPLFVNEEDESLLDKLKNILYDPVNNRFYNDYALWLFKQELPENILHWKSIAKDLFEDIVT